MSSPKNIEINISKDWSKSPTGRYPKDGKSNGTDFKTKFIYPHIENENVYFKIILDGTRGYGSSFLDESFAGLVRDRKITKTEFLRRFSFTSEVDPSFIDEILEYVDLASQ